MAILRHAPQQISRKIGTLESGPACGDGKGQQRQMPAHPTGNGLSPSTHHTA